tara:strand:- start:128 stop:310 length:183 start_codon:yes stop_codon:yes gene_type:complete
MDKLIPRIFQFEEVPEIDDVIKALKQAKEMGYVSFKPYIMEGDYKPETMDLEKLLRIYLF